MARHRRRNNTSSYGSAHASRSTGFGGCLGIFLIVVLVIGIGGLMIVNESGDHDRPIRFEIAEGQSFESLADALHEQEIVSKKASFSLYASLQGVDGALQPGVYRLPGDASIRVIVNALKTGPPATEGSITLVEGLTNAQMADQLAEFFHDANPNDPRGEANGIVPDYRDQFVAEFGKVDKYAEDFPFLAGLPQGRTLEGYLFPDTYTFFYTASPEDVVFKMLTNFDKRIDANMRSRAVSQLGSLDKAVRLGSVVQAEAGRIEDMEPLARVFRNRLDIGYKLESDATVNYLTGKNDPTSSAEDLAIDSPYNTYQTIGLPRGPIGNPGLAAVKASVEAADHDFFYFVTDLETGEAFFAKTFDAHQQNVEDHVR